MASSEEDVLDPDRQRRSGRGLGLATRVQVTAHQFMARRAALAMTRRSVGMETEPGRRQTMSIAASISLTAVLCGGALFWSMLRPAGSAGDNRILEDQSNAQLYVKVGQTLYPALNLASARLIAGSPDSPKRVRRSEIEKYQRGPMVGIPGAEVQLTATVPPASTWLVCDTVTKAYGKFAPEPVTVTVINGQPELDERRRELPAADAVVLRYGPDVWLIRDGRRSRVDVSQQAVLLALGLPGDALSGARPMSRALFDALPVAAPLAVPVIPGAGTPAVFPNAPGVIGTVVSTPQVGGEMRYSLVLADGVQAVTAVAAQVLHNSTGSGAQIPVVAGPALAAMPMVDRVDLSVFPDEPLNIVDTQQNPSTCWMWQRHGGEARASTAVVSGTTLPIPAAEVDKVVSFVKPDKAAVQADRVYFGRDYANFVVITGSAPDAATQEAMWLVSESGVRFGVPRDEETLRALGLGAAPQPAPWSVVRLLAPGPTLSRADALLRHDALPANPNPGALEEPR